MGSTGLSHSRKPGVPECLPCQKRPRPALGLPAKAEGVCCLAAHRWAAERLYRPGTGRGGCGLVARPAGRLSSQRKPLKGGRSLPMQGRKRASEGNEIAQSNSGAWYRRGTGGPGGKEAFAVDLCRSGPLGTGGRRSGGLLLLVPDLRRYCNGPRACKSPKTHLPHEPLGVPGTRRFLAALSALSGRSGRASRRSAKHPF